MSGATPVFALANVSVSSCYVFIDNVLQERVVLNQNYPIEGYQMTVFRKDGLPYGPHTLKIQVVNTNGSYVVVDAFDVR